MLSTAMTPSRIPAGASSSSPRPEGGWWLEGVGVLVGLALAVIAVAHVAASDRAWMLFSDGDSVLPALVRGSIEAGQAQAWSLSSVLFVPETALYLALSLLGTSRHATLALNGVVNLALLFGAMRLISRVALRNRPRLLQVGAACAAAATFAGLCLLEGWSDRNGLELATLSTTTTYYFATLLALVVVVGLTASFLAVPHDGCHPVDGRRFVFLFIVTAASTWTNPLFVAWAVVSVVAVTFIVSRLLGSGLRDRRVRDVLLVLGGAVVVGWVLRLPVRSWIATNGATKIQPWAAPDAARFYLSLVEERVAQPAGLTSFVIVLGLLAMSVVATVLCARRGDIRGTVIVGSGWLVPVCVVAGSVLLGTQAARYLQPVELMPVIALMVWPSLARFRLEGMAKVVGAVLVGLIVIGAVLVTPGLVRQASIVDPSVRALDSWIESSGRVGAGQYWTVRAPKAYLTDPRLLVQVDGAGNGYAWLTNDHDFDVAGYSFVVVDDADPAPAVPPGTPQPTVLHFGRYTVLDYGDIVIPLGPMHH